MRRLLFALVLLLAACTQASTGGPRRHIAIVSPASWWDTVAVYANLKQQDGFTVTRIDAQENPETLRAQLLQSAPDYVLLVGSQAFVPTVYRCSVTPGQAPFEKTCIYSDYWLTVDDAGASRFPIGRVLARTEVEFGTYVAKAAMYSSHTLQRAAYVINDRAYDADDITALGFRDSLLGAGLSTTFDVVNSQYDPFTRDNAGLATPASVSLAVDQDVDFIQYYGHAAAIGWGAYINIPYDSLRFHNTSVTPLVVAIACETTRSAPNPPWYTYVSTDGELIAIGGSTGVVPAADIPDPSPIQPELVLNDTIARRFTSATEGGPMVYIGETVVTTPEFGLQNRLYSNLLAAYATQQAIGDIWFNTINPIPSGAHPEYFQLVGDPSTEF